MPFLMRTLILMIALTLLSTLPARAAEVLILQTGRSTGYTDALRGFHTVSKKAERIIVLSDYAEVDVYRIVKEERPRLVVALGDRALAAARKLRQVPVVAVLSFSLPQHQHAADNVGGITMVAGPEHYLKVFSAMGARRIGVVYDPAKTGRYLKRFEHDSQQLGLNVVAEPVSNAREIQSKLEKLHGRVDALWMLPDSTVFTPVNKEAFILFSMAHNVPVVTFSRQHLQDGAAASLDIDYFDMGLQAGEIALSMLNGCSSRKVPTVDARKAHLHTNESLMRKLGIPFP